MITPDAIPVEERPDLTPFCPHCEASLRRITARRLAGMLGRRYIYCCGHCSKVLGVTHRKGFWMG